MTTPIVVIEDIARIAKRPRFRLAKYTLGASGIAARAPKIAASMIAGARTKSAASAPRGIRSSFARSLMPSASDCAQPCHPPAYIGPKRHWMWPETLRSSQTANITSTETNPTRIPMPIRHAESTRTQLGTPAGAIFWSSVRKMFPPSIALAVRLPDHDVGRTDDGDRVGDQRSGEQILEHG